jgi:DNA-binding XRE family transcriptional regulator
VSQVNIEVRKVLENIRKMRIEKGMTIVDLATEAEISNSYLYYIETKRKVPTLTVVNKLAKALNVKMKDFFD